MKDDIVHLSELRDEVRRVSARQLENGGGPPRNGGMGARVEKLERHSAETIEVLRRLEPMLVKLMKTHDDVAQMKGQFSKTHDNISEMKGQFSKTCDDVLEMKGRLSQVPTLWQLAALIFAIFGAAFVVLRFGMPHP